MDFAAEREKRRAEDYQRALARQDVGKRAEERAREISRALDADIQAGSSGNVQVSVQGRTVMVRKDVDLLNIEVQDDLSCSLNFKFGKLPGSICPTIDRVEHAGNDAELAAKIDLWRGFED